jgi:hypothetical protein
VVVATCFLRRERRGMITDNLVFMEDSDSSDSQELKSLLRSLSRSALHIENLADSSYHRLKNIRKKAKMEVIPLRLQKLQAKPPAMVWLKKRKMLTRPSFREFFRQLIDEHAKEDRLELTNRSIRLNEDASQLFGVEPDTCVSFFELMAKLPEVFY